MGRAKGKKLVKKPTTYKVPFIHSFILFAISLSMLGCICICIINSLTNYHVADIWFYQNIGVGGFTFILGFLMGENATRKQNF